MNESKATKRNGVKRKQKAKDKVKEKTNTATTTKAASKPKNRSGSKKQADKAAKQTKKSSKKSKKEETASEKGPKRAWPAFFFFQKENREKLKKDNPELSQKDLVSKLGEMWRGLSEDLKKPYLDQEREDKARYNKEKELFKNAPAAKGKSKNMGKGKGKSETKGPKRAWPPFFFYQQDRRENLKKENPDLNHKEIVSKLGEEWRSLTDEKKKPFIEKGAADQKRYEKEKKEFKKTAGATKEPESKKKSKTTTKPAAKPKEKVLSKKEEAKSKPKKAKKRTKSKTLPVVTKKKVEKPKPPPRPAGGRSSKRIKRLEEEQYKAEVQEYKEAKGLGEEETQKLESLINNESAAAAKATDNSAPAAEESGDIQGDNDAAENNEKDISEKEVSPIEFICVQSATQTLNV